MKRIIVYMIFLAILLYFSVLYANPGFLTIFLLLFLYTFLAEIYLVFQKKNLLLTGNLKESMGNQNQEIHLPYVLKNNSRFFPIRVRIFFVQSSSFEKEETQASYLLLIPPRRSAPVSLDLTASFCGKMQIKLSHFIIYDWFSFFQHKITSGLCQTLFIYPKLLNTQVKISEATSYFCAESEDAMDVLKGQPYTLMPQIRKYEKGDRLCQIHWKLSARMDELLVKEKGQPDGCPVLIFLQLFWKADSYSTASYSSLVEAAFSLAFHLIQQKCRHYIIWYDEKTQELIRMQLLQEEDLFAWIYTLFHSLPSEKNMDLLLLYKQKYPSDTYRTTLEFLPGSCIVQNQELLLDLTHTKNWQSIFSSYSFLL